MSSPRRILSTNQALGSETGDSVCCRARQKETGVIRLGDPVGPGSRDSRDQTRWQMSGMLWNQQGECAQSCFSTLVFKTPAVIKVILICSALPCLPRADVLPIDFLTSLVSFPSPARQHPEESVNGALLTPAQSSFTRCSHKDPFTLNIHYRSAE